MKTTEKNFDPIEAQAAAWLVRRDGGLDAGARAEFERWCAADPRHAAAVREIAAVWAALDRPAAAGLTESMRAELRALGRRDRQRWLTRGTAAALATAACVAVYFGMQHSPRREPAALAPVAATARVTEPERRTLPDGSVVEFKPGAEITVAFREEARVVILKNGEAHFSVTKDPRKPFIVEAATVRIRAVGTAFAVQLGQAEVEVLVTEGKVSVSSPPAASTGGSGPPRSGLPPTADAGAPPLVGAGQRAIVALGGSGPKPEVVSIPVAELTERLSWRRPRLDFSESSVAEAIALFNRHNRVQLRAADDAVSAMRITGVFGAENIEGFVRALESTLGLRAEHRDREILLRSAP